MASVYGLGKTNEDPRSGGKIITKRHTRLNTTPYDRPPASLKLPPKNSNWISDVIFPATRLIASGAAKLWSSVFDDSDDDSSLSSSSSDSIPASENYIEDDNYYDSSNDNNCLVEDHGATSEATPQPSPQISDANHVEQLLLKGEFSRQDCHRFMKLIESRVSGSNFKGGEGSISTEILGGNLGSYMDDVCSKAVLEARKWLEEKKVIGYSPLSHMADASDGLKSFSLKHLHNEVGSPADVARVYMKYRPPWASLSGEHCEARSPLTITSPIFRGGLFSAGEGSLSSVKKRSSLASGSWNIQEEIRKVRSKATKDLLHSSYSAKFDTSSFTLSAEHGQASSVTKLSIPIGENEGNMLNSSENIEQLNQLSKFATTDGNCEISDLEVIEKMAESKALEKVANPATTSVSEKYSALHSIKIAGESTTSMPDPASKDLSNEHFKDPSRIHLKGSLVDKISKCDATQTSVATLSAEVGIEENQSKLIEKNMNDEKAADFIHKHEFLSETSGEVPVVRETNSFDKLSHRPAGMGYEELSGELSPPYAVKVTNEAEGVAVKLEVKKTGKYSRRNKGRGK